MQRKYLSIRTLLRDVDTCRRICPRATFANSAVEAPKRFALSAWCSNRYDQALLGTCTANAILHVVKMTDGEPDDAKDLELSRLFLYTQALLMANPGAPLEDLGCDAATACMVLATMGVCEERFMPYTLDATKRVVGFGQLPSPEAVNNARAHTYPMFQNVTWDGDKLETIKSCISTGWPVLIALVVFPSFDGPQSRETGIMPMPSEEEKKGPILGGHQMVAVDYDEHHITCMNSYGENWGRKGFVKVPVDYLRHTYPIPQGGVLHYCQQLLVLQKIPDFAGTARMHPALANWDSPSPNPSPWPSPNPPAPNPSPWPSPNPPAPNPSPWPSPNPPAPNPSPWPSPNPPAPNPSPWPSPNPPAPNPSPWPSPNPPAPNPPAPNPSPWPEPTPNPSPWPDPSPTPPPTPMPRNQDLLRSVNDSIMALFYAQTELNKPNPDFAIATQHVAKAKSLLP